MRRLLRVALTAPPLERAGIGVGALVFAIGLTFAYPTYGPGREAALPPRDTVSTGNQP
ncbi:MAG: hypothetical protein KatS3mg042_1012 [Rhodothermaceae bacterium]|nr:MAG: hypothetical protein KatS3mg042_1012 [Rhodothermaceae bacterium]